MKKFLSLILTVVMALGNCTVFADGDKTETEQKPDVLAQQLGFCDFDGQGSIVGGGSTYFDSDEHKNVAEIPAYGAIGLNFGKKINSGKVVMSYDIKFSEISACYIRTFTEENRGGTSFESLFFRNDGYAYVSYENRQRYGEMPRRNYEKDKWYSVDIWYDFDNRIFKIYFDGMFLGQEKMCAELTEIASFAVFPTDATVKIDNIGALYIPSNGAVDIKKYPFIHCYDHEYDNDIQPWIETGKVGNAFFGDNLDFKLKIINNKEYAIDGIAKVRYINSDGVSITEQEQFKLDGYDNKIIDFNIKNDCFGYAKLEASIVDKDGNILGTSEKDISVLKQGKRNGKIGFADHHTNHHYKESLDSVFDMLKLAGAGNYRDSIASPELMNADGGIKRIDDITKMYFEKLKNKKLIKPLNIIQIYSGEGTALDYRFPTTKERFNTWLTYVNEVLELTKDIDEPCFEIGNEFNYSIKSYPNEFNSKMYYELCKTVYPIIKQANPNAKVYTISSGSTDNTVEFVEDLLKYGIADYSDGFTLHPYDVFHSTENEDTMKMVKNLHDLLEKYGAGDKPVIYSEYGWTTSTFAGVTDDEKARYVPQAAMLLNDYIETIDFYNLVKKTTYNDFEDNFGFLEGDHSEVPFKPTKAFMSLSNYNYIMPNIKSHKELHFAKGDATVCVAENEDGKNSIMAWMKEGKPDRDLAIDLGASTVDIYDIYGNKTSVKTENGVLNISLGQDPVYIVGDISDISEISEKASTIFINEKKVELVSNDTVYITGKLPDSSYEPELICPDNIKAEKVDINSDGTFRAKLSIGNNGQETEKIRVRIKKNGDTVYGSQIEVSYTKAVEVVPTIVYYKDAYWQLKLKVVNKSNSIRLSGKVILSEPSGFEIPTSQSEFEDIAPGTSKYIYINISPKYTNEKMTVSGYVETTGNEKIEFSDTSYFVGLMHLSKEPTIDGKISSGEYNMNAPVRLNTKDYVINRLADYPGFDETSGNIYLNYDEKNLYLAAKIYDSVEGATGDNTMVWQNDSIQLAFAEVADLNAARTEYCIGKDNKGVPTITRYAFMGTKTVAGGGEGDAVAMGDDIKLEIGRDGKYTIYEFKVPWTEVFGEERPTLDKRTLLFSALINDNDGLGRTGYVEFCPGIGGQKNPAQFSKLQAMK